MAMERWIREQIRKGNEDGAEAGKTLLRLHGDVALPDSQAVDITLPQPVALEIPTVSEALYRQTREAVAKEGFSFVVTIKPVSVGQLLKDAATRNPLGCVNRSVKMRSIVPPQMEIAVNPNYSRIGNSDRKPTNAQIEMHRAEETALKNKLPKEVRNIVSMPMLGASVLIQLDAAYQTETHEVLFTNWFGRTNDETSPGNVAGVGRYDPSGRLAVSAWYRDVVYDPVFAVPVVVLPRKQAEPVE